LKTSLLRIGFTYSWVFSGVCQLSAVYSYAHFMRVS
jgi:hypothetical protein